MTLSPSDTGGSGLANTYHKIDSGSYTSGTTFTVSTQGAHTIYYYSVDNAGNQETPAKTVNINVDLTAPTVSSITPSVNPITSAQLGLTFSLTITYNAYSAIGMNKSIIPTISLISVPSITSTLSYLSGGWNSAGTAYTAVYNVLSTSNVSIAGVTVQVSGAKDIAGNTQTVKTMPNVFAVNTVNPVVVSVTPSVPIITNANVGTNGFHLTISYSEAMNASVAPAISFSTNPNSILTFNPVLSGWNAAHTVYTAYYNVANVNVDPSVSVNVTVNGAKDTHCNLQTPKTVNNAFSINVVIPPVLSSTSFVGNTYFFTLVNPTTRTINGPLSISFSNLPAGVSVQGATCRNGVYTLVIPGNRLAAQGHVAFQVVFNKLRSLYLGGGTHFNFTYQVFGNLV